MIALHTGPAMRVSEYKRELTPAEKLWEFLGDDEREITRQVADREGIDLVEASKFIVREARRMRGKND